MNYDAKAFEYNPYTLPTIEFVGGETLTLIFNTFIADSDLPFTLTNCTCNLSIASFINKRGTPVLSKSMDIETREGSSVENVLKVTLSPTETVDLSGKYIYQISVKDYKGDVEIPKHGIMYITNNINRKFI